MEDFSGKTVIVSGGAQGIGLAIVLGLLQKGANVVAADFDREAGEELQLRHPEEPRLLYQATDVRDEAAAAACAAAALERFGGIDGLVNNAGIAAPGTGPVRDLELADWENMLRTNLTGAFLMTKHAAEQLEERRGAIVNISSTRALQSEPHTEAYAAAKGGLVALTHALAASFSGSVRVNCILPGWIDVSGWKKKRARYQAELSEEDHRQHPAGRVGVPEDIAELTAFLLSSRASFITGQSFVADGGMTRKMIYVE